jgi:hypothetical protein
VAAGGPDGAVGRLRALEAELKRVEVPYEEWEVLFRALLLVRVAALERGGTAPESLLTRTLIPLGLGLVRQTLESRRVRRTLDDVVVGLLSRLTRYRDARPADASHQEPRAA